MSGDLEFIFFDFDSDRILTDKSNILRLMIAMTQDGEFRFTPPYTYEYPVQTFVENTPTALSQAWDEALSKGKYGPNIGCANSNEFGIDFGFAFDEPRQLVVGVNNGYISYINQSDYENVKALVKLLKIIYVVLGPEYGYGLTSPDVHPIRPPYKVGSKIPAIYDFNFFGLNLVKILGREKVLSVSTWQTVEFDDGGVFLGMSPNPIADWKPYTSNYKEAAKMFGVEKFYQG